MQRFLIFGVGGPSDYTYPTAPEGAEDLVITSEFTVDPSSADLPITASFDVATVGHLIFSSEFTVAPTGEDIPITSQFTTDPTGEDLAITSSFITGVV